MTIITESLISEFPDQKIICLNDIIKESYNKSLNSANSLGLTFDINNADIQKLLKHNLIIDICEFKKKFKTRVYFFIDKTNFDFHYLKVVEEVFQKMELYSNEKSKNFLKKFKKYLKTNGFNFIVDVYLKQATNKLALFR